MSTVIAKHKKFFMKFLKQIVRHNSRCPRWCSCMLFSPVWFPLLWDKFEHAFSILCTSTASTYFYLPIDKEDDADIKSYERKYLTWIAKPSGLSTTALPLSRPPKNSTSDLKKSKILQQILKTNNLYDILGISKTYNLDYMTLHHAYLSQSCTCHPECI